MKTATRHIYRLSILFLLKIYQIQAKIKSSLLFSLWFWLFDFYSILGQFFSKADHFDGRFGDENDVPRFLSYAEAKALHRFLCTRDCRQSMLSTYFDGAFRVDRAELLMPCDNCSPSLAASSPLSASSTSFPLSITLIRIHSQSLLDSPAMLF